MSRKAECATEREGSPSPVQKSHHWPDPKSEAQIDSGQVVQEQSQAMHKCAVAYMSDAMLLGASLIPAGRDTTMTGGRFFMTSVDHALWFHHPVQADDWLLYEMDSPKCGE